MNEKKLIEMQVHLDCNLKEAMKQMDKCGWKMLIVVDEQSSFIGLLSDGEVRRRIISDGHLNGLVRDCYNPNPISVLPGTDILKIKELMIQNKIEIIPCVDVSSKIHDLYIWSNLFSTQREATESINIPVIIMAGGKGTRMKPITHVLPKPLIPIQDEPVIDIILKRFHQSGIQDFYITLNHKKDLIKAYLQQNEYPFNIHTIEEKDFLGTAGSLKLLPDHIDSTCLVTNCDILVDLNCHDLLAFHQKSKNDITIVGSIQNREMPYGIIDFSSQGIVKGIREKPEMNFTINTGVYMIETSVLHYIEDDKVFHMTDLIEKLISKGKKVSVYPISEKSYSDIGQWDEYRSTLKKLDTGL